MTQDDPTAWELFIRGEPVAQPRARAARRGGTVVMFTPTELPANQSEGRRPHPIMAWKLAIQRAGSDVLGRDEWITGPIQVDCEFVFARPGYRIWKRKPMDRYHLTGKPDRDNLDKAVLDALTGILWRDDAQVASGWTEKWVAAGDEEPHARICVSLLPGAAIESRTTPQTRTII